MELEYVVYVRCCNSTPYSVEIMESSKAIRLLNQWRNSGSDKHVHDGELYRIPRGVGLGERELEVYV